MGEYDTYSFGAVFFEIRKKRRQIKDAMNIILKCFVVDGKVFKSTNDVVKYCNKKNIKAPYIGGHFTELNSHRDVIRNEENNYVLDVNIFLPFPYKSLIKKYYKRGLSK